MAAGEPVADEAVEVPQRRDFFGAKEDEIVELDDAGSHVRVKYFVAGDKSKYLKALNRQVELGKDGKSRIQISGAEDQAALLRVAITGWGIYQGERALPFTNNNLRDFLSKAPVDVLDTIEKQVRKMNPFLDDELTVEEIDAQITDLEELRAELIEREGKEPS